MLIQSTTLALLSLLCVLSALSSISVVELFIAELCASCTLAKCILKSFILQLLWKALFSWFLFLPVHYWWVKTGLLFCMLICILPLYQICLWVLTACWRSILAFICKKSCHLQTWINWLPLLQFGDSFFFFSNYSRTSHNILKESGQREYHRLVSDLRGLPSAPRLTALSAVAVACVL